MKRMWVYVAGALVFMMFAFYSAVKGDIFVGIALTVVAMLIASLSYI